MQIISIIVIRILNTTDATNKHKKKQINTRFLQKRLPAYKNRPKALNIKMCSSGNNKKHKNGIPFKNRKRSGRPHVLHARERRLLIRLSKKDPFMTASDLKS
ncbi:hypothetical protein A3Q56_01182 [Intoshia linei]|uniref:Uncharacterized protein n=1 Tax=Intoshia linei TaxID=1819745 RepID=A0A177BBP0_9BILA|nr:hypothetical protein A3Q56_01182 [Intoshia linei]